MWICSLAVAVVAATLIGGRIHGSLASRQNRTESMLWTDNAAGEQLVTLEPTMTKRSKVTLNNATIIKLSNAHVNTAVIIKLISNSNADYDLSANSIIDLQMAKLDPSIIVAMINADHHFAE